RPAGTTVPGPVAWWRVPESAARSRPGRGPAWVPARRPRDRPDCPLRTGRPEPGPRRPPRPRPDGNGSAGSRPATAVSPHHTYGKSFIFSTCEAGFGEKSSKQEIRHGGRLIGRTRRGAVRRTEPVRHSGQTDRPGTPRRSGGPTPAVRPGVARGRRTRAEAHAPGPKLTARGPTVRPSPRPPKSR